MLESPILIEDQLTVYIKPLCIIEGRVPKATALLEDK